MIPPKTLLTAVTFDARWAGANPMEIAGGATDLDAAGIDMLVLGGAALGLDPLIMASWLAPRLKRIGLVCTLPALHTMPFHAARALSALDFLTHGLSGWAPATLGYAEQAVAIGPKARIGVDHVLTKAVDFIGATCALWDSWDADALIINKGDGVYLNSARVRRVNYRGPHFQVMGPLNAARPPQGYPVLVQSDVDPLWRLTAGCSDVLLVHEPESNLLMSRRTKIAKAGGRARLLATVDLEGDRSAEQVVNQLQRWLNDGRIDGVHVAPAGPEAIIALTSRFLPELRRQGLLPSGVKAGSLRSRLGLRDHENAAPVGRISAYVPA